MNRNNLPTPLTAYTIGHSNHEIDRFIQLLSHNGIEVLVDVRSSPYSRFVPQFNKDNLSRSVKENGIKYLFLGLELGGMPKESEFYDSEGHVLYSRIAETAEFINGIERIIKGISQYRVALMCSEERPDTCHRFLMISRVLEEKGVETLHILGDGRVLSKDEILLGNQKVKQKQQTLFNDSPEWKSVRPVLKKLRNE